MKILVIGNFSDRRCGISNMCHQTAHALSLAGHDVTPFDGTYSEVYRRRESSIDAFFPPDIADYEVVHVIWHAMTLNHYNGADWARLSTLPPVRSFWDCGPSDAYCPFDSWFPVKWMLYEREGYHQMDYPVPDWVAPLPIAPDPGFVVGSSSVRGDGIAELRYVCEQEGWTLNLPEAGTWVSIEDEIRRLARSTVNVCWYDPNKTWKDRASAPSMMIASTRPLLVNNAELLAHLQDKQDLYHGTIHRVGDADTGMRAALQEVHRDWQDHVLRRPSDTYRQFMWKVASKTMADVWEGAR